MTAIHGLHHVTCIAGDPQENVDFYVGVMGLRLVKRSVNQDAPGTYHLFYADRDGTPGTDLTFFPWPEMGPGQEGHGLAQEVTFAIREGSLSWWRDRLTAHGVPGVADETRFGERSIAFRDPHGLRLALVETVRERPFVAWRKSTVPEEHQLRGMDSVRLLERDASLTGSFLTGILGFEAGATENGWQRYSLAGDAAGTLLDVAADTESRRGRWGVGAVHHVAWRVTDSQEQVAVRALVERAGRRPTPVIDRFWFESVYFLEPGGVLFELATDGPGFSRDELAEELGSKLILPPWLEGQRGEIEAGLVDLQY